MAFDLDAAFYNPTAREFVTTHTIGGIRGKAPVRLDIIADHTLYKERNTNGMDNTSFDGVVIYIKKAVWNQAFGHIPKVRSAIKLDNRDYQIEAVDDDMGMLELTLSGTRG